MKTQVYIFPDAVKNIHNNSLELNKIRFSNTPYKKSIKYDSKEHILYYIDMYYKNNSIILQLPKYKVKNLCYSKDNDNDSVRLKIELLVDDFLFQYLISPLEEHIISSVHSNSEKWFNGKRFTMNKIINCLISPYNKSNENILNLTSHKNTLFFNRYKNIIDKQNIIDNLKDKNEIEIIPLIKIANLQFLNNKFSYNIILEQAKVFMEDRLIEYSIIDEPDGKVSESISSSNDNDNKNLCNSGEYYKESIDSIKHDFF